MSGNYNNNHSRNGIIKQEVDVSPPSPTSTILHSRNPSGPCNNNNFSANNNNNRNGESIPVNGNGQNGFSRPDVPVVGIVSSPPSSSSDPLSNCEGVRDKLRYILGHPGFFQDVIIIVQGKEKAEEIQAHKLILKLGSPVLRDMLDRFQIYEGTNNTTTPTLYIPDVEPTIFKQLLQFLYTDEFEVENLQCFELMEVLRAARKYQIVNLMGMCLPLLKQQVNDDTAVELSRLAEEIGDKEFQDTILQYIRRNANKIFLSKDFLNLSYENLALIVDSDELDLEELTVFQSVVRWAEDACRKQGQVNPKPSNIRETLRDILYRVRFPVMSAEDFTFRVTPMQILTSDEQISILKYLSVSDLAMKEQLQPTTFKCTKRTLQCAKRDHFSVPKGSTSDADTAESEDNNSVISSASVFSGTDAPSTAKKRCRRSPSPASTCLTPFQLKKLQADKSKPTDKKHPAGEPVALEIADGEVRFDQLLEDCKTHSRRHDIQTIRLAGTTVLAHDVPPKQSIRFPRLRNFHLNIKLPNLTHGDVNELAGKMRLADYLFFTVKKEQWSAEECWSLRINVSLVINGITLLKIDPKERAVVINKVNEVSQILAAFNTESKVKSLVMSSANFPNCNQNCFPFNNLEKLVILSVEKVPDFNAFIRKFKRLKELCIHSTDSKTVDLSTDLVSKDRLKKLALASTTIKMTSRPSFKELESLFLFRSSWDAVFENSFGSLFPNLKKVSFYLGTKITPQFLSKIIQVKSITEIMCSSFDWDNPKANNHQNVLALLHAASLTHEDVGFVLTKSGMGTWTGVKSGFDLMQEEVFNEFQFNHIYQDYELFRS